MERYIDGFLIPIAKDNIEQYRAMAAKAAEIWKEYGALEYYECVGDDLEAKEMLSFCQSADASADETVIFSWIIYESKAHRDRANAAIMNDPRIKEMMESGFQPVDYTRMAYGGFRPLVTF